MNMSDYLNEFEHLNIKLKEYKIDLPEPVLAYHLLKSANISQEKEQLARATLTELTYAGMKKQLKKIFDETGVGSSSTIWSGNIKIEPVFQASCTDDEEDILYGKSYRNWGHRNFQGRGRTNYHRRNQISFRATKNEVNQKQKPIRKKNPPDAFGYPSKCMICKSMYHWANNCPEHRLPEASTQNKAENITLFTESVQSCYVENFLGDTLRRLRSENKFQNLEAKKSALL